MGNDVNRLPDHPWSIPNSRPAEAAPQACFHHEANPSGSALGRFHVSGGSGDDSGQGIAIDSSGNAYVSGGTYSTDFHNESIAADEWRQCRRLRDQAHATGSALVYSTYLGGDEQDGGASIAVDNSGDAYVTGFASSTNFPTTPGAFQTTCGATSAFVTEFNGAGSAFIYSTCLGTVGFSVAIALDSSGNAYVAGGTRTPFPQVNPLQPNYGGGLYDAFVSKLNAAGSALLYSTYLGGSSYDFGQAIALDGSNNVYVTGLTQSTNFPTVNPLQPIYGGVPTTPLWPKSRWLLQSRYRHRALALAIRPWARLALNRFQC